MIEALIKGLTLGFLLSIAVGPVLFSIIKQSLNNGHQGGIAFVIGVFASDVALVLISNVFTEFFKRISNLQTEIGVAGCIFLVTLGIYFVFFKKVKINEAGQQVMIFRKRDYAKIALSGFFMNILNPAVFLFWIYASSLVVTYSVNHRIFTFAVCLLWMLGTDLLKVFLAGKIRNRLTPHNIHILHLLLFLLLLLPLLHEWVFPVSF